VTVAVKRVLRKAFARAQERSLAPESRTSPVP
jgi:hypothetical protein